MTKYSNMKKDVVYRVTKGNTDGGIMIGNLLFIDSRDDSLVLASSHGGWYTKDDELMIDTVTDFECEIADEYLVMENGHSKIVVSRRKIQELQRSTIS